MAGTGWRVWRLRGAALVPQWQPPWSRLPAQEWQPGWNVARCLVYEDAAAGRRPWIFHEVGEPAPARKCYCGIHVCPSPESLLEMPSLRSLMSGGREFAMGLVQYEGKAWPGAMGQADPAGTLRVERARLLHLDLRHVPRYRQSEVAEALQERYGVRVFDDELRELHEALFEPSP
jgi:hypothetical protein